MGSGGDAGRGFAIRLVRVEAIMVRGSTGTAQRLNRGGR